MDVIEFDPVGKASIVVRLDLQSKQNEWRYQWSSYKAETEFLFRDWIYPRTLDDFRNRRVFDAGCGRGQHAAIVARVAQHVTGMDLNAADIARDELAYLSNVTILEGDISVHRADVRYDVVYCIGVIHHTDNPDRTFENLKRLCRPGSLLIVWCYSREGNAWMRRVIEPLRKRFLSRRSRGMVVALSWAITLLLYPLVCTLYCLPLHRLPYYEYFQNFRRLGLARNMLNVFDKLNAPQTDFISYERVSRWFNSADFSSASITSYKGVSWRASGVLRGE